MKRKHKVLQIPQPHEIESIANELADHGWFVVANFPGDRTVMFAKEFREGDACELPLEFQALSVYS